MPVDVSLAFAFAAGLAHAVAMAELGFGVRLCDEHRMDLEIVRDALAEQHKAGQS
jgi:hypothetical protein